MKNVSVEVESKGKKAKRLAAYAAGVKKLSDAKKKEDRRHAV